MAESEKGIKEIGRVARGRRESRKGIEKARPRGWRVYPADAPPGNGFGRLSESVPAHYI